MTQISSVIYTRVSSESQDYSRQIINLKKISTEKGWTVRRTFAEKISGTTMAGERIEFKKLIQYVQINKVDVVLISEISRLGRKVVDILNTVDELHKLGVGIYVQQFGMQSLIDGKENPNVMLLLQTLSIGAEMENSLRKIRQLQGIELARHRYKGRKKGARTSPQKILEKYSDIVDLLKRSELSLRRIAAITNHSVNTVRRVKKFCEL